MLCVKPRLKPNKTSFTKFAIYHLIARYEPTFEQSQDAPINNCSRKLSAQRNVPHSPKDSFIELASCQQLLDLFMYQLVLWTTWLLLRGYLENSILLYYTCIKSALMTTLFSKSVFGLGSQCLQLCQKTNSATSCRETDPLNFSLRGLHNIVLSMHLWDKLSITNYLLYRCLQCQLAMSTDSYNDHLQCCLSVC